MLLYIIHPVRPPASGQIKEQTKKDENASRYAIKARRRQQTLEGRQSVKKNEKKRKKTKKKEDFSCISLKVPYILRQKRECASVRFQTSHPCDLWLLQVRGMEPFRSTSSAKTEEMGNKYK